MAGQKSLPVTEKTDDVSSRNAADFETAIEASGFGLFNVLLLLTAWCSMTASAYEIAGASYILPSAECDLKLTLLNKGMLIAISYAGIVTSGLFWGYISDTNGRRKVIIVGLLTNTVTALLGSLSQNVWHLLVLKYLGGFFMCGPYAVIMTYLSELHGKQYRARVMMLIGVMYSTAAMSLPALALTVLPQQWEVNFLDLTLHSWHIFLAICAIPSALSGCLLHLFPESPKFLMSQGRNEEAMEVFQKIYALNFHKSKAMYPIKALLNELPDRSSSAQPELVATVDTIENSRKSSKSKPHPPKVTFRAGLLQLRPLFRKPYLGLSIQFYLMNFCLLIGLSTITLWLPQLFASIREFEATMAVGETTSLCSILEYSVNKTAENIGRTDGTCSVVVTSGSYINNIIVAFSNFLGYAVAGFAINLVGVKPLTIITLFVGGIAGISFYWSSSSLSTLILACLYSSMGYISAMTITSASTSLFPTSLRSMIVCLGMISGRLGSLVGNIIFPVLIPLGCIPPILMIGLTWIVAGILAIFLPNPSKAAFR